MRGGGCVRRAAAEEAEEALQEAGRCQGCYGAVGTLAIRQTMRNEYRFTYEPVQKIPNDKNRYRYYKITIR